MSKRIVAIITRTKNRNVLLERAVKSVVSQVSKNYVHVILNDGGDHAGVEKVLDKYPDKNRVIIHNKKSVGLTRALNQAIKSVKSDYIAILDDDDSWLPERIGKVSEYLDEHTDEPGVAVWMDRVIEEVKGDEVVEVRRDRWYEGVSEVSLYDQLLDNYLTNNCITYRRSLYDELGGYDETLEVAEDWDFGIRYLLKYDIFFIPEVLALYHHRPDAKGPSGNSVFAGRDTHRRSMIKLRNRYLRQDIDKGRFGIGYIMNQQLSVRKISRVDDDKALGRVVRLEGHINYATEQLRQSLHNEFNRKLDEKLASVFRKAYRKVTSRKNKT